MTLCTCLVFMVQFVTGQLFAVVHLFNATVRCSFLQRYDKTNNPVCLMTGYAFGHLILNQFLDFLGLWAGAKS